VEPDEIARKLRQNGEEIDASMLKRGVGEGLSIELCIEYESVGENSAV